MTQPDPADESAIRSVLARYCRGVDRRDWELVRSCYHDDAFEDHGIYRGDVDGFVAWVADRHQQVTQSMHVLANVFIEEQGDAAVVESDSMTSQESSVDGEKVTSEGACRYVDRFERRDGAWRIARRTMVVERLWPGRPSAAIPDVFLTATRDADDPSFVTLADVRGGDG